MIPFSLPNNVHVEYMTVSEVARRVSSAVQSAGGPAQFEGLPIDEHKLSVLRYWHTLYLTRVAHASCIQ